MRVRVCVCVKELMNAGARVCVHLFKHTQTKHVTHNTVHGNVFLTGGNMHIRNTSR